MSNRVAISACLLTAVLFFGDTFFANRTLIPAGFLYQQEPWGSAYPQFKAEKPDQYDLLFQFYPWAHFFKETARRREIPLWNPYTYLGTPFFANPQTALLFPLTWIHLALPLRYSFTVIFTLKLMLLLLGMYFFLREQKLSPEASFLGACIFAFSMHTVASFAFPYSNVTMLFPWTLLAASQVLERWSASRMVALTGLLTLIVFAGQPQSALLAFVFMGLFAGLMITVAPASGRHLLSVGAHDRAPLQQSNIGAVCEPPPLQKLHQALFVMSALVIAALLSAIQWIPSYEYFWDSMAPVGPRIIRSGLPYSIRNFLNVVIPDFFGNPGRQNFWGFPGYQDAAFYSSAGAILLASFAFSGKSRRKDPLVLFLLATLLVSCLVLLGTPIIETLLDLPGFRQIRRAKFVFLTVFALAGLAALGSEYLFKRESAAAESRPAPAEGRHCWWFVLFLIALMSFGFWEFRAYLKALELVKATVLQALHSIAFLALTAIIMSLKPFGRLKLLLPAVLLADLVTVSYSLNARGNSAALYPPLQTIDALKGHNARIYSFQDTFQPNAAIVYRLEDLRGYDVMTPRRLFLYLKEIDPGLGDVYSWLMGLDRRRIYAQSLLRESVREAIETYGPALVDYLKTSASYYSVIIGGIRSNPEFFDLLDIDYLFLAHQLPPAGYVRVNDEKDGLSMSRKTESARVRFYTQWTESSEGEVLRRMKSVDVKKRAIVEFPLPASFAEPTEKSVTIRELERSLRLRCYSVETDRAGIFVESERFCPGWNAYVDGKRQPVFPANYLFRGVFLTSGRHRVDLKYEPWSLYWGGALSVLGLIVLGGTVVVIQWRVNRTATVRERRE